MKILIDNSNLFAGGGIQVATSFLNDLNSLQDINTYYIIQSSNSSKQINKNDFDERFIFFDLTNENSSILKRIKNVKKIERQIIPDVIFTIFGPSYHRSSSKKIVGFALPYIIYPDSPFFRQISLKEKLKYKLLSIIKSYFFYKNSNVLIFESEDARIRFNKNKKKSYTVNNTLNSVFDNYNVNLNKKVNNTLNILCLSANYPHKNLGIIPKIIENLLVLNPELKFYFNISSKKKDFNFEDKYDKYINYLGAIEIKKLPSLYEEMDILFMPSLLEVFSTTYLEAMFMKVPIICSDMSFARYICGNAAIYCNPLESEDYAKNIIDLYIKSELRNNLVNNGIENLKRFGTSMDRTKKYLEILKKYANEDY